MLKRFAVTDNFLGRYEKLVREVVIPYQEKVLGDEIEGVEKSHALDNFRAATEVIETGTCGGAFYGMVFQDSDVAKWLEAAAYSLQNHPDPALEERCDGIIDLIGRAQHADGYLNTYFTVQEPGRRWANLREAHELYCAGHMMEAAVAYYECTGKAKLLGIMTRMADHIYKRFVEEGAEGYPGHPEVELALMRLYRCTHNGRYKALARHFVDVRGVDSDYFIRESERIQWSVWGPHCRDKEYAQSHAPVRQQTKAVGHAVRAVYLYTAMADIAAETGEESLAAACKTLWDNIVQRRMFVTGAIGSAYEDESFTKDYHLPNDTAYAETCASIALIFFARKMLGLHKRGAYADVMERALYNCVLAGMELDGARFFYVNPLEVAPGISGEASTHLHTLPQRPKWFACACCPPNVARLLSSIGKYAWSMEGNTLYSHLFVGGVLDLADQGGGKVRVETEYPFGNQVTYRFEPNGQNMQVDLAIRLPQWSRGAAITRGGEPVEYTQKDGYALIPGPFSADDTIAVTFEMRVERVFASAKVSANSGRVAFARGPLVYCLEGIDNAGDVLGLYAKKDAVAQTRWSNELNGLVQVQIDGYRVESGGALYSPERPKAEPCTLTLIPYYAWGNRGLNQMRVWIPEMA